MATTFEKSEKVDQSISSNRKPYTDDDFRDFILKSSRKETGEQIILKKITPHFYRIRFLKRFPRPDGVIEGIKEVKAYMIEVLETPTGLELISHPDR
jgi:hypothetical protein